MSWLLLLACSGAPEPYGVCEQVEDCADQVPEEAQAVCLDKAGEGFCTWSCELDEDCVFGEEERVCASFEDEGGMHCFPGCEGDTGEDLCPDGFTCRSTGGGEDNRKVCFPEE